MTFELVFVDVKTDKVNFVVPEVVTLHWITPSEISLTTISGRLARCRFKPGERLVINRMNDHPRTGRNGSIRGKNMAYNEREELADS